MILALLKSCAKEKDLHSGSILHIDIVRRGLLEKDVFLGSALVNMYAKCGALDKAQQVFDELPLKNSISWNSLITAYTQSRQGDEALRTFEKMKLGGFGPDGYTFSCILKACGLIGSLDMGQEVHAQIARENLSSKDLVVGNALVDMYAKCGSPHKAHEVFDTLPSQDVVTWNGLIGGYTEHGYCERALHCFDQMQAVGFPPNAITYAAALKACSSIGDLRKGQDIHNQLMEAHMLGTNLMVTNALLAMYAKCNALDQAREVLDAMPRQTVVSWTALIGGYSESGPGEEALLCFEQMQSRGFSPDIVTFSYVLKACGNIGAIEDGQEIHFEIVRNSTLKKDVLVFNALIDMYAKCGALEKAKEIFESLPSKDMVTWNILIAGFTQQSCGEDVFCLYDSMLLAGLTPNEFTFACILKACGTAEALTKGLQTHAQMRVSCGQDKYIVTGTALVDMYAKCGQMKGAEKVFMELPARDVVSWNALISGYVHNEQYIDVLQSLEEMEQEDILPDEVTLACMLKACCHVGDISKGQTLHAWIVKLGLLGEHVILGNALIDLYGTCSMLSEAQAVFDGLVDNDVVSWNALIAGYSEHEYSEEALSCYHCMQVAGIIPDAITFACIGKACSGIGFSFMGQHAHADAAKHGLLGKGLPVDSGLLNMYASCGMLAEAQIVFDSLLVQDLQSWTALMAGYAQYGNDEVVILLFEIINGEGIETDPVLLTIVLFCCSHRGLVDEALWCFDVVSKAFIPTVDNYACIIDLFCRSGRLDKATMLLEIIPFLVDFTLWRTLLGACCKWLAKQLGRWVFDHAVQLNEKDGSAYVCLSNIYVAAAGRSDVSNF